MNDPLNAFLLRAPKHTRPLSSAGWSRRCSADVTHFGQVFELLAPLPTVLHHLDAQDLEQVLRGECHHRLTQQGLGTSPGE